MAGGAALASASSDGGTTSHHAAAPPTANAATTPSGDQRPAATARPRRGLPPSSGRRVACVRAMRGSAGISAASDSQAGRSSGQSSPKCSICTRRNSRSKSRADGKTPRRVLRQHLMHDAAQRRRQVGTQRFQRLRRLLQVLHGHAQRRFAGKRRRAGQHVVAGHAERVDVAPRIERLAFDLLGAHVERRAQRDADLGQVVGGAGRRSGGPGRSRPLSPRRRR